jgi:hypothetical protein
MNLQQHLISCGEKVLELAQSGGKKHLNWHTVVEIST